MATNSDTTMNLASATSTSPSVTDNDLSGLIKIQGDLVRKLKAEKASSGQVRYLLNIHVCIHKENYLKRLRKLLKSYLV